MNITSAAVAWLATYLIHSTLLLTAVWLLGRVVRDRPALMDSAWKLALVAGLFTATAQQVSGVNPLAGQLTLAPPANAAAIEAPAAISAEAEPAMETGEAPLLDDDSQEPIALQQTNASAMAAPGLATNAPTANINDNSSSSSSGWMLAILVFWLAGACLGCLRVARRWAHLRRRLSTRRVANDKQLDMLLAGLIDGELEAPVRLTTSNTLAIPVAMGLSRQQQEICLPDRAAGELSTATQRALLAHEVGHLIRKDPIWRLAVALIEAVLFFQPLNRIAGRQLESLSETLCDDWAVSKTTRPLVLARCLTDVAGWAIGGATSIVPAMASQPSRLAQRVHRLLAHDRSNPPARRLALSPPTRLLTVVALLGLVAWTAPGISTAAAEEPGSNAAEPAAATQMQQPDSSTAVEGELATAGLSNSPDPSDSASSDSMGTNLHARGYAAHEKAKRKHKKNKKNKKKWKRKNKKKWKAKRKKRKSTLEQAKRAARKAQSKARQARRKLHKAQQQVKRAKHKIEKAKRKIDKAKRKIEKANHKLKKARAKLERIKQQRNGAKD